MQRFLTVLFDTLIFFRLRWQFSPVEMAEMGEALTEQETAPVQPPMEWVSNIDTLFPHEIPTTVVQYPHLAQWSRGWGIYHGVNCVACGHEWVAEAPIGTIGVHCPNCGVFDNSHVWAGFHDEYPNDGAWLL